KSAGLRLRRFESYLSHHQTTEDGCQMTEGYLLSVLCSLYSVFRLRVYLNGRATAFQADDEGSIPFTRSKSHRGPEVAVAAVLGYDCPMNVPVTRAAAGLAPRVLSVDEVVRMVEAGVISEDERLEVIGGEIVPMPAKGARHESIK